MFISREKMVKLVEKFRNYSNRNGYYSLCPNTMDKDHSLRQELLRFEVEECEVAERIAAMTPVARTDSPSPLTGGALDKNS
jgi:hypothetical protein